MNFGLSNMSNSINNQLMYFIEQCTNTITDLSDDNTTHEGVAAFKSKLETTKDKVFTPTQLPVISKLKSVAETPFTFNFSEISTQLKWRPSPRTDPNAEVIALSVFNEMLNLGGLVAGLMFMSPNQIYPEHKHPPQEIYFVLSGTASWLYGGNTEYQQQKPGDIIYNHPQDMHGMKTGDEALLALYFLWGDKTQGYSF